MKKLHKIKSSKLLLIMLFELSRHSSTTICLDCALYLVALYANQLWVFASIHTAWNTAKHSSEPKQTHTPCDSYTSNFLSHNLSSVLSTELAWSSIVLIIQSDDSWSLLWLLWRIHWLRHHRLNEARLCHNNRLWLHHDRLWLPIHWLSVHLYEISLILWRFYFRSGFNQQFEPTIKYRT